MHPALLSLLLLMAAHVSVPVDCRTRLRQLQQLLHSQQPQHSSSDTAAAPARTLGRRQPFYLELSETLRDGRHRPFLVILPARTDTNKIVSIFDLRRRRFVCVDSKGELYKSDQRDRADCLFQRMWLGRRRDLLSSVSGGQLLKVSSRRRRSEQVNPSDPLRSQPRPSHPAKEHKDLDQGQPERDQAGAVSKETITSCDDPLKVLQPNGPVSPVKTNIADQAQQH